MFLEMAKDNKRFTEDGPLKYMMVAGEAFPKELVKRRYHSLQTAVLKIYTDRREASIYSCVFRMRKRRYRKSPYTDWKACLQHENLHCGPAFKACPDRKSW